ncbi:MAG: response regulator [Fuerstiella sp.]|nr:response regulator [Fuerstiella sp.]
MPDPIQQMQQCIDNLEAPIASELNNALNGVRAHVSRQAQETRRLSEAQADAIVHAAEIITELQETKDRLEVARLEAEAAAQKAEQLSAFGDILEQSLNEIFIFEVDSLHFLHVNHGGRENIGYTMEELRELTPIDIKPQQTAASFAKLITPLLDGTQGNIEFEAVHRRKDGSEYPVQIHLETSVLGESPVFVAIILDITERQSIEEELRTSREDALAADRSKSDFLANMSHEIRTPMTAILGFSDVLLEPGVPNEEKLRASQTIHRNGQHLLKVINDILDLSKVESGRLDIEQKDSNPAAIVRDVKELLAEQATSQGNDLLLELRGDIPLTIQTDPTRLKQALINLAGNAVKFTKNGTVRIVADCDRKNERLSFCVTDSGIGITSDQMERIFHPFGQADSSTTREYGGTGLGLTITKRIAEALGGDVSVESEPGRGSTFTLSIATGPLTGVQMLSTLDDEPTSCKDGPYPPASNVDRIDGRVLLVEDGPDNQRIISLILRKFGADVTLAENGKEGVDAAISALRAGEPFGVILMDMQMPIMDGYTATEVLRDSGYSGQIVALTAHAMKEDVNKCLAAGCDAYLSKPIDRKTFVANVAARMGKPSTHSVGAPETAIS